MKVPHLHLRGTLACISRPSSAESPARTWVVEPDDTDRSEKNGKSPGIYARRIDGDESFDVYACIAQESPGHIALPSLNDALPSAQDGIKVSCFAIRVRNQN